ncbi:response regulator [Collimonas humicola]|uniref:response regulator n=1 Tax=Collimonas humicola TaxID=2825886 RepID=UPI001B8AE310|nr:response regulator [Collimonas humicola]
MKIKTKLMASTGLLLLGVMAISVTSLIALTAVSSSVYRLTDEALPLQLKTSELQRTIEKMSANFFTLGMSTDRQQQAQSSAAINGNIKSLETITRDIQKLDRQGMEINPALYRDMQNKMNLAVSDRLSDTEIFRDEARNVKGTLTNIEQSISTVKTSIDSLNIQAEKVVAAAQQENLSSNQIIKEFSSIRLHVKDLIIIVGELETVKNRYRLTPLVERMKAAENAIKNISYTQDDTTKIKEIGDSVSALIERVLNNKSGLIALRAKVFANISAEADYFSEKKNIIQELESVDAKISEAIDPIEMQLVRDRHELEAANAFLQQATRVKDAGNAITVDVNELNSAIAGVILSESESQFKTSVAVARTEAKELQESDSLFRKELLETRKKKYITDANAISRLIRVLIEGSERIITAKARVLVSDVALREIVEQVNVVSQGRMAYSDLQVEKIGEQQQGVVSNVQGSVNASFIVIMVATLLLGFCGIAVNTKIGASIVRPLSRLSTTIERIRGGKDLSLRVLEHGSDEIGILINGFNSMLENIDQRDTQLKLATAEAQAGSRAKSEFLAKMSHEIRTPMNGVLGMTELLLRTDLSAKQQRFVNSVYRSGESLLTVIDDILDFSKIEAGRLTLEQNEFNLRQTIDDVIVLLAHSAHRKDLDLICHMADNLPQNVQGDSVRLRQVITNLINNAIKFTDHGQVVLDVRCEDQDRVCFTVSDTGIGIAPGVAANLFQPFQQADSSISRKYGGTGLGLVITKQLVEMMGGTIELKSSPGQGSIFSFTLHFERLAEAAATHASAMRASLAGVKILIVDDNATDRSILLEHAGEWKMDAASASSGAEALQQLRAAVANDARFDVAIIDVCMPVMDGAALVKAVKADASLAQLKIIMLTSFDTVDDINLARKLGVEYCFNKPVRGTDLYDGIVTAMAGNAPNAARPTLTAITPACAPADSSASRSPMTVKVLLAEDNTINQEIAAAMLEDTEYHVTIAENGHAVLSMLAAGDFDVVLMDCQMPEMDGFQATRVLRRQEHLTGCPRIPVIALTANAIGGDRERCLEAGMDDYISKPFRRDILLKTLAHWTQAAKIAPSPVSIADEALTTSSAMEAVIIDPKALQALRSLQRPGRPDVLTRVVDLFILDAPRLLAAMRKAVAENDAEALRHAAHTLKSTSANVGAVALAANCREIEQLARSANVAAAAAPLDGAVGELDRVLAALALERVAA